MGATASPQRRAPTVPQGGHRAVRVSTTTCWRPLSLSPAQLRRRRRKSVDGPPCGLRGRRGAGSVQAASARRRQAPPRPGTRDDSGQRRVQDGTRSSLSDLPGRTGPLYHAECALRPLHERAGSTPDGSNRRRSGWHAVGSDRPAGRTPQSLHDPFQVGAVHAAGQVRMPPPVSRNTQLRTSTWRPSSSSHTRGSRPWPSATARTASASSAGLAGCAPRSAM